MKLRGPKTEGMIERLGQYHIRVEWVRLDMELTADIYEPYGLDLTPALADLLVLALEARPRFNPTLPRSDNTG